MATVCSVNQTDTGPPPVGGADTFPKMYARTRRFSVGLPRNLTMASEDRVLFLRSKTGDDPVLCLWSVNARTGAEEILVDPATLTTAGDEIPAAELARRERARESGSGIVSGRPFGPNPQRLTTGPMVTSKVPLVMRAMRRLSSSTSWKPPETGNHSPLPD